jgi:hypothetical protein
MHRHLPSVPQLIHLEALSTLWRWVACQASISPLSHLAGDRPWSGAVPTAAIGSGHRCHPPRAPTRGVSGAVHGATWGGVSLWLVAP